MLLSSSTSLSSSSASSPASPHSARRRATLFSRPHLRNAVRMATVSSSDDWLAISVLINSSATVLDSLAAPRALSAAYSGRHALRVMRSGSGGGTTTPAAPPPSADDDAAGGGGGGGALLPTTTE
jgi:hypothetical protein